MADFLRNWIMNITVIIILIMFMDTIMPNNSMKRYINVIVGLLIIVVVIRPFVLVKDYAESFNSEFFDTIDYIEKSGYEERAEEIGKYHEQKAVEIFEDNLREQIKKLAQNRAGKDYDDISVELKLEKDVEKEDFGYIRAVTVNLSKVQKEIIEVDKIKINTAEGKGENKNVINKDKVEYNLNDSKISEEIRDGISEALGISRLIVNVNVQQ